MRGEDDSAGRRDPEDGGAGGDITPDVGAGAGCAAGPEVAAGPEGAAGTGSASGDAWVAWDAWGADGASPAETTAGPWRRTDQPMKVAAMEALWHTTRGAPFVLFVACGLGCALVGLVTTGRRAMGIAQGVYSDLGQEPTRAGVGQPG